MKKVKFLVFILVISSFLVLSTKLFAQFPFPFPSSRPISYPAVVLRDKPTYGYWRLNETAGTSAADSSGNGNTGTYQGTCTLNAVGVISDNSDPAVTTNGTNCFVSTQTQFGSTVVTTLSIEAWFKTSATTQRGLVSYENQQSSVGSVWYSPILRLNSTGKVVFYACDTGCGEITSTASYNDGMWHHVVGTIGASGRILYVDGIQVANGAGSRSNVTGSQAYWRIGFDTSVDGYFLGTIDEVSIYDYQLSASQVSAHLRAGISARSCKDILDKGMSMGDGVYLIKPTPSEATPVYCDMTLDGGGWILLGTLGDSRLLPNLTNYLTALVTTRNGTSNRLHSLYASIVGNEIRVGRQVGTGTATGNFYEINDCGASDAACWYGAFIDQNDGDTFGAWITQGGAFNFVPAGCTTDTCPATGGDRDHSLANRIAIFGGDCHSTCKTGGNDTKNGLIYRDYQTAASPNRIGNRSYWGAGTVTSGSTALGVLRTANDYGQAGTAWRDIWIR